MNVGFVGAGKVGFSLGKFFGEHGIRVTGYYSRHAESAREAAVFTETDCFEEMEAMVKESDVIFLTVPDGEIKAVYEQLKRYDISGRQICHCSGAMTAEEAFPDAACFHANRYSIHPLFPVSNKLTSYRELADAFFCLEGDEEHLGQWENFFREHCKGVKIIDGSVKAKYHAACVVASNLYCALMKTSLELLESCGFEEAEALNAVKPLVESNLKHILEDGPVKALTGPAERGDALTVEKHLGCIEGEIDRRQYLAATRKLLDIAQVKNPDRNYEGLSKLLENN